MLLKIFFNLSTLIFFLIFLFKLIWECIRSNSQNIIKKLPPGPWKLPLLGNLHHLVSSLPHHVLRELSKKHGPLMHLQLGEVSAIVVSSPNMAKEVLKTHDLAFAQRPELLASKILSDGGTDIAFAPYGKYWRQMRKVCVLELLSAKRVQSFASLREDEASNLIKSIPSSANSPVNLTEKIFSFTCNVTCRAAFSNKCKDQDAFISLTRKAISLAGGFALADLFRLLEFLFVISGMKAGLVKIRREADKILDNIIHDHRENRMSMKSTKCESEEEHLVDVLLRLQESGNLECPTDNIKAVIWDIFSAGSDRSSTLIVWAMSEMMKNPRVMEKAQAELRETLKGKKKISATDIQESSYLKLVIKETLRLYPPGPLLLPRGCREQCEIDGYKISIKTEVIANAWAIGRDPEYWHDAESFVPAIDFKGTNFEYIPFGAGRRICPGMSFGLANIELPLAQLLYHFDWKLPGRIKPEDLDMTEAFGANVTRKNNLYLIATSYTP